MIEIRRSLKGLLSIQPTGRAKLAENKRLLFGNPSLNG